MLIFARCIFAGVSAQANSQLQQARPTAPSAPRANSQRRWDLARAAPVLRASIRMRRCSQRASFAVQVRPTSSSHTVGRPTRVGPFSDSGSWQSECAHGIPLHSNHGVNFSLSLCPGKFSAVSGKANCDECGVGKFASVGSSSCSACSAGQYQGAVGQSACSVCSAGQPLACGWWRCDRRGC